MPLLAVIFPANAQYFLSFIVDVVNFNVVPTDKIIDAIVKVEEKINATTNAGLSNYGFKNTSVLKNLGMLFIALIALAGVIIMALFIRLLTIKVTW